MSKRLADGVTSDVAKGERSPLLQQQASVDRHSDNDSNASGSGVPIKKTAKNAAQKTTKPLRHKRLNFDPDNN